MSEHALVLGGTSPVGIALANRFLRQGHLVSVVGRPGGHALPELGDGIGVFEHDIEQFHTLPAFYKGIVTERGDVSTLVFFQRYRGEAEPWMGEYAVSIRATQTLMDVFSETTTSAQGRSVVIVTSPADTKVAAEQHVAYHAAKAALSQMVRYYAVTLGSRSIRVNGVQPGVVLKARAEAFYARNPKLVRLYESITPLGRMGTPDDVADAIEFLCGSAARFITGQILVVDGGASLHETASLARLAGGLTATPVTIEERSGRVG